MSSDWKILLVWRKLNLDMEVRLQPLSVVASHKVFARAVWVRVSVRYHVQRTALIMYLYRYHCTARGSDIAFNVLRFFTQSVISRLQPWKLAIERDCCIASHVNIVTDPSLCLPRVNYSLVFSPQRQCHKSET